VIGIVLACKPTGTQATRVALFRNDSTLVSIDTADISWRADTASLWIDYYLSRPVPYGDNANSLVYRREVLIDVHCASSQAQDRRLHVFDKGGNLLHDEVFPTPGWQPFVQSAQTLNVYQPLCTALIPLQPQRHPPAR
jgi:hypothetical protein